MVLGEAFRRCLSRKSGVLERGISAITKKVQRGHSQVSPMNQEEALDQNVTTLVPWSWTFSFQNWGKYVSFVYKLPRL